MLIDHDTILSLELPFRERLTLQRTSYTGGSGPRVGVISGIHGDELEGLYVAHRLAAWLEDLGRQRPEMLRGRIEVYPAVNPLGLDTLERGVPPDGIDLNRVFPGHAKGLMAERVAAAVMREAAGAALVVDIHASNIFLREIPQVRINHELRDDLVPLAQRMNLDVIWVHGAITVLEATVAHSLNRAGTPCLVVEMGVGMRVTPELADQLIIGLLHTWRELGVFDSDLELPPLEHEPFLADDNNVHYLNAVTSGIFVPTSKNWTGVQKDELLGRIISPHHGEPLSEVRSPTDGVLFTLREYPLVYEGSLMARIMS
jgi:predicted deacylase